VHPIRILLRPVHPMCMLLRSVHPTGRVPQDGSSVLHAAACGGHVGVITALLDHGGVEATDTNQVRTVRCGTVWYGMVRCGTVWYGMLTLPAP
jgi:hypothetical protein